MDMVRTYFEKTQEDTSVYFTDKAIWAAGREYQLYQGKYPVIFLSFKDAHQTNPDEILRSICFSVKEEYLAHIELLSSDRLNEFDIQYFRKIAEEHADEADLQFALGKLSLMLAKHFGQKVIVIIDEYDTPIQQAYLTGCYDQVVGFMRNLLSAVLKDNEFLEFGIMTGILRVAKESLFSGLNNLVVNTILDNKYAEYFGFTKAEVLDMAAYYGKKEKVFEIQDWYDGYRFGNEEIYNPWSVISYFNNDCTAKAFWSRTSGNELIGQLIRDAGGETYESLTDLLQGKEIHSIIDTDIIYPEVKGDPDMIYSFLAVSGYLKITGISGEINDTPVCSLSIPNKEIKSVFQKEILSRYSKVFSGALLRNFEMAIRGGDDQLLTDTLRQYLMQSASTFDTANEDFYHGIVLGMLAVMSDSYYISSNRESGEGRFDVQLEPKNKKQTGYILELKADKQLSEDQLKELADEAIRQIKNRHYDTDMKYRGITDIVMFGVAFSGKRVSVTIQDR